MVDCAQDFILVGDVIHLLGLDEFVAISFHHLVVTDIDGGVLANEAERTFRNSGPQQNLRVVASARRRKKFKMEEVAKIAKGVYELNEIDGQSCQCQRFW